MGKLSRTKGRAFEQKLARIFRKRWPAAVVRRASQADRAHQSDVYIAGGPAILGRLWIEAQDARKPDPLRKLHQAERDIGATSKAHGGHRLPLCVWHRIREREIHVTTRLWVVDEALARFVDVRNTPVTMTLDDFLELLS